MQALPVNRLYEPRATFGLRDPVRSASISATPFQTVNFQARTRTHKRQRQHSRTILNAQATDAPVAFQSIDDSVWDKTYAEKFGPLHYGLATLQGPRNDMEDYASIVARGKCGFLYAGEQSCLSFQTVLLAGKTINVILANCSYF